MRPGTVLLLLLLAVLLAAPAASEEAYTYTTVGEVKEVAPGTPVRIKLKKNSTGTYSWEITGTDVGKVIEADQALRQYVARQKAGQ